MFYSPQILSQRNKTEISLVYYISTVRNVKKNFRKEVIELDFNTVLEKIKNPKVPFALRLYSYLLNGIVKMWIIKIEYYKAQAKNLLYAKKKLVAAPKRIPETNVNLRIIDQYISDLEECSNTINENNSQEPVGSIEEINNRIEGYLNGEVEFEQNENFLLSENASYSLNGVGSIKKLKRTQVDRETTLEVNDIYTRKIQCSNLNLPNLVACDLSLKFENFISELNKAPELGQIDHENQFFENEISIEDPRISSTVSSEKNNFKASSSDLEDFNFKFNETKALSFYNILLEASKGEIEVYQRSAFEIIEIRTVNGIIYF